MIVLAVNVTGTVRHVVLMRVFFFFLPEHLERKNGQDKYEGKLNGGLIRSEAAERRRKQPM